MFIVSDMALVFDADGNPNHIDWALRDITDRKLMEDKIREKDIRFRKLSSNLPDLIFQFTRGPDRTYSISIASEGIKNIFGGSPEDVLMTLFLLADGSITWYGFNIDISARRLLPG